MNKKIFTGLILLMGFSIVGIIVIQLIWMNNAIRVKNELFDRGVSEALNSTTSRLEIMQDFRMINHFAFGDSTRRWDGIPVPPPPPAVFNRSGKIPVSPRHPSEPLNKRQIELIVKAGNSNKNIEYQISTKNDSPGANEERIIFINSDSIVRNLDSVYTHGIIKLDSMLNQINPEKESQIKLRQRFEIKSHQLKRVANKVIHEISAWEQQEIKTEQINELLKKELENRQISIPFESGIFRDSLLTDKTQKADSLFLLNSPYKVNLFRNDIFQKNMLLSVYFPDKETYIYQALNWLLVISLIFSIIVLLSFSFSIYYLLKQKKISEMKSDFINNMTHEFKTPIATIAVAADSITNLKIIDNPERIRYFTEMIKKENTRMNRQVEDILTIARLDKKEFDFRWEAFNLHEAIEDAIQSIVLQVNKKGGTINCELAATNPVATSDPSHFANMVYNLLDNANKYSPDKPEIRISTLNTAKGVIIKVEDKGIGMTKSVQSRIFERFYRQTSGNIHNVKGFGLGLSYVKAVLEANHGNITVHSEPGKGSRFEVFIPYTRSLSNAL